MLFTHKRARHTHTHTLCDRADNRVPYEVTMLYIILKGENTERCCLLDNRQPLSLLFPTSNEASEINCAGTKLKIGEEEEQRNKKKEETRTKRKQRGRTQEKPTREAVTNRKEIQGVNTEAQQPL